MTRSDPGEELQPSAETVSAPHGARGKQAGTRVDAYGAILTLARQGGSPARFLGDTLRCVSRYFASPYAAIHVRYASEVVHTDCHGGPTHPAFWKPSLQRFLTESLSEPVSRAKLLQARTGPTKVAFLFAPIFDPSGGAIGGMALVVGPVEEDQLTNRLAMFESLTRLISFSTEFLGDSSRSPSPISSAEPSRSVAVRGMAQAAGYQSLEELAFAITNDLCNKIHCEQVSLGMAQRQRVKVVSISGLDTIKHQSPGVASLRAAMEECLDCGTMIVYQKQNEWSSEDSQSEYRLHKQWHAASRGDAVASIPLRVGDETVALLSMRRTCNRPFQAEQLEAVRVRMEALAPALRLTQQAGRGLLRHGWDCVVEAGRRMRDPGRLGFQVFVAVLLLGTVTFFFGSAPYDLAVPCTVTPAQVLHITSPLDTVLRLASAVVGDHISQGDVLCELDHRLLDQRRAELAAEEAVYARKIDRALAADSPIEVELARARRELLQTKLDIVNSRILRATIRSPIDGVVVAGDLRKRIGSRVARGDPLFQIARSHSWALEAYVPEHASAELRPELTGRFVSFARSHDARLFRITRVLGDARIHNGGNVYVAEAYVDATDEWMRPGLEGIAKIHLGRRRIWWIVLHRAIDYVRLHIWP